MIREMIAILDFGSQYGQLIARRVRENHVFCQIEPPGTPLEAIRRLNYLNELSRITQPTLIMVGASPGGGVFRVLIMVIGNLVIIVLEGLIVTIQVVRLQYYEFFSKFFTETGEAFTPFTLDPKGGSS